MSKRKTIDKAQARERRNRLLESAAAATLSLTEGVREMRAIAGMTQEEFARHREVSARVIKAIELGQGNPTVATLNRIGQFFGLEVGFVPIQRLLGNTATKDPALLHEKRPAPDSEAEIVARVTNLQRIEQFRELADITGINAFKEVAQAQEGLLANIRKLNDMLLGVDQQLESLERMRQNVAGPSMPLSLIHTNMSSEPATDTPPARRKKKPRTL